MKFKFLLPLAFTIIVVTLFYYTRIFAFKFYPVCMNFFIFIVFFSSLFTKETIIQRIARLTDGNLSEFALKYTKNLTYIWCIFLFLNFLVSLATIFLDDKIWMIYNGCLSYIFVGTFFIIEYIIRIIMRKKYD